MPTSSCTLGMLLNASYVAYDYHRGNTEFVQFDPKITQAIRDQGYSPVLHTLSHDKNFKSNLGAVVLAPDAPDNDPTQPIVIAYRGTLDKLDLRTDVNLTLTGTAGKEYRDEAYKIYLETREKYPKRPIVFTGHSLGGHLAQYVASKASFRNGEENFEVRTFNTAAIDSRYSRIVNRSDIQDRFINYRLENDVVSMVQRRIGDTYSFPAAKLGYLASHELSALKSSIPQGLLEIPIGKRDPVQLFREQIQGLGACYQCRINGQFFSSSRAGFAKNEIFQRTVAALLSELDNPNVDNATKLKNMEAHLSACKRELKPYGKGEINHLIHELEMGLEKISESKLTISPQSFQKFKEAVRPKSESGTEATVERNDESKLSSSAPKPV